jgi:hypothetical protein
MKITQKNWSIAPKRLIYKNEKPAEQPSSDDKEKPKAAPKSYGNIYDVFKSLQKGEAVPASAMRVSVPRFKSVDEYPRNAKGQILDPVFGRVMNAYQLHCAREWYDKLPAVYKMEHDPVPDAMPEKLAIPADKELFLFGGANNGKGAFDQLSGQYKDNKMNFLQGQTLAEMIEQAKTLQTKYGKEKLAGSTAAIMVDPDIFFDGTSAEKIDADLKELCKTLKGLGLKVAVAGAPQIEDYFYGEGGPKNKDEQRANYKKTEVPREKRSKFNETIRKIQMSGGDIDKVFETDVPLQHFLMGTNLHPDYRKTGSYLNDNGLNMVARIFADGINRLNSAVVAPGKVKEGEVVEAGAQKPVGDGGKKPNFDVPKVSPTGEKNPRERVERLIKVLQMLREGKMVDQPREVVNQAARDIEWAKQEGIDPAQVEELEKNLKVEMPKLLLRFAEAKVDALSKEGRHPDALEIYEAIVAVEEAEKVGVDKEKIATMKKKIQEVKERVA